MRYFQLVIIAFVYISVTSCHHDDIDSNQVSTDSFVADFHVTNGGTGTTAVEAQLRDVTTNSFIDLKNGDRLLSSTIGPVDNVTIDGNLFSNLAQSADQIKLMTGSFADATFPSALLNFTDEVSGSLYQGNNAIYTISLERPRGADAPDSNVALPPGFSITAPQQDVIFSRSADDIMVRWDPVDIAASITVSTALNCYGYFTSAISNPLAIDGGYVNFSAGTFTTTGTNCTLRIVLDRYLTGAIDSHFAPGSQIIGHQKRYIDVTTVP